MITHDDVTEYLENIQQLEQQMKVTYGKLAKEVKNRDLQSILQSLSDDEERHREMITAIIDQFKQKAG
ncbi:MAG: ferritin family protein [Lentisphaeria bacterium]